MLLKIIARNVILECANPFLSGRRYNACFTARAFLVDETRIILGDCVLMRT
jgi:hypothetical protein